MVTSSAPADFRDETRNIMVIGALGAGKSSVLTALFCTDYDIRKQDESFKFKASKSLKGFTNTFNMDYSNITQCMVTDTPGLGDKEIPVPLWLDNYNNFIKSAPAAKNTDLVMIVIERKERVSMIDTLTFGFIDLAIKGIQTENMCVIFNKCDLEEDTPESVMEFYNQARQQAKTDRLPNISPNEILMLGKQSMGRKDQPLEAVPDKVNALIRYMQGELQTFLLPKITKPKLNRPSANQTSFDQVCEKTQDEMLKKQLAADKQFYQENMKMMQEMMAKQQAALEATQARLAEIAAQPPPPSPICTLF